MSTRCYICNAAFTEEELASLWRREKYKGNVLHRRDEICQVCDTYDRYLQEQERDNYLYLDTEGFYYEK